MRAVDVRKRQTLVTIVGFAVIGALSFVVDWPWWQLALVCVVPYGVAIVLAGRRGNQGPL
ncbi:hypothetical protein SAMN05216184_11143 [Georgenia satyanarayanai]|uniref:Uncharacterized protein n=1 Tax=Georgenia satyanarayanai TaxID=860221 RepID=A0A2Y9AL08_9MICO|nr:hypothetical protein [Georgenia satyanarayanai]PYF98391.1 hypothetical protein A8987_11143 [Georgenia satyanarayanai]SSA45020.1 hypothetical protein SAMN05216184_11143 [Georgenia satyanarayanai]